jgi:hypothetical protein
MKGAKSRGACFDTMDSSMSPPRLAGATCRMCGCSKTSFGAENVEFDTLRAWWWPWYSVRSVEAPVGGKWGTLPVREGCIRPELASRYLGLRSVRVGYYSRDNPMLRELAEDEVPGLCLAPAVEQGSEREKSSLLDDWSGAGWIEDTSMTTGGSN